MYYFYWLFRVEWSLRAFSNPFTASLINGTFKVGLGLFYLEPDYYTLRHRLAMESHLFGRILFIALRRGDFIAILEYWITSVNFIFLKSLLRFVHSFLERIIILGFLNKIIIWVIIDALFSISVLIATFMLSLIV